MIAESAGYHTYLFSISTFVCKNGLRVLLESFAIPKAELRNETEDMLNSGGRSDKEI